MVSFVIVADRASYLDEIIICGTYATLSYPTYRASRVHLSVVRCLLLATNCRLQIADCGLSKFTHHTSYITFLVILSD